MKDPIDPARLDAAIAAYSPRVPMLKSLAKKLEERTTALLEPLNHHVDRVSFRAKGAKSYAAKSLKRTKEGADKYAHPLVELEDQVAGRVLVFFRRDMDAAIELLKPEFNMAEHTPKGPVNHQSFSYESDHLVCMIPIDLYPDGWLDLKVEERPKTFELQVRTLSMHAWAEPEHNITYKPEVEVTNDERRKLAWAAASAWGVDQIFEEVSLAVEARIEAETRRN